MSQSFKHRSLCVMLGLIGSLGLHTALPAEERRSDLELDGNDRSTAQLVLANELMRIHWTSWVTDDEHAAMVKNMIRGINDDFKDKWKVEWLVPEVVATKRKRDAFEKSAIEDIRAGEPILRRTVPEGVQFVLPVRAKTTCLKCHTALRSPTMPLQKGDLLGIVSVRLKR